jgi:serine/threonine-protein kinase
VELSPDLVIAERFRLVRPLGEGGMGAVWMAHHIRLQMPCAVKFMRPEVAAEPSFRSRFDREAVAAAQLRSPHVVQVLDHGVWEAVPYIAMEYLEGEDLEHRLGRLGRLSPEETVTIVVQVARALTKAHGAGLVHRDLKPANIFIVHDDDREIVKVLDFGVAKSSAPSASGHTKTGAIMGTPYYMSPEQAQGTKGVDRRTDLWALGVVAYQCLTGTLPFDSEAFGDLVLKIIVEPLPVPSQVAAVPAGFDAWWARAVERNPDRRFQTAKELADALVEALGVRGGEGVGAATALLTPAREPGSSDPPRALSPGTPSGSRTPAGVAPATTGASSATDASPASGARSRSLVLGALVVAVVIAAVGLVRVRGNGGPAPQSLQVQPAPPAPSVTVAPVPEVQPSAAPSAVPSAAPSATATASAHAAPSALPSAAPATRPAGTARPAAGKGHDLGF